MKRSEDIISNNINYNQNNEYSSNYKADYNSNHKKSTKKNLQQGKSYINDENENNEHIDNKEYLNTKGTKKTNKNIYENKNENYENENNNNIINNEIENNGENKDSLEKQEENQAGIEKDEFMDALDLDLKKQAEDIFNLFVTEISPKNMDPVAVDLFEMQNLLEVIGIRKNEFEINCAIKKIKSEKLKSFKYEDKFTKGNFIDIVESFLEFRIEDKLLVEVFRKIDLEGNGILNLIKMQEISKKYELELSNEELVEILEFFNMEKYLENKNSQQQYENFKSTFDFEKFCKLYYQGG